MIRSIWSPTGKVRLEREFWLAVLRAQKGLGLEIPDEAIAAYEAALDQIDLEDICQREARTKHDVKARIESFNAAAGQERIHQGLTSRDLTENVEQLQIVRTLRLIRTKAIATLAAFARRAEDTQGLVLTARTHNVAAQPTTFGKRLAMFGQELLLAVESLDRFIESYPLRGIQGAVGTRLDLSTLFQGDSAMALELDRQVLAHFGIQRTLGAVGQVYPRSLDLRTVSALCEIAAGPSSFARTLRIMAGHETAGEGFAPGQTGSSAMPHKMNSRSCERINAFAVILRGYLSMVGELAGDQWNEGDVSCSAVRRVALPDAFFAIDGLLETTLTVLGQMEVHEAAIEAELARYLPFLATTTLLMEAVKSGTGRETAHAAIKEHALATVRDLRSGTVATNDLGQRLASDDRLGLSQEQIDTVLAEARTLTGQATAQVETFAAEVQSWLDRHPEARELKGGSIL